MNPFTLSIHVFRRDLRLQDNNALISALENSEKVIPVFILDERQLTSQYFGKNSFSFMIESLKELDHDLRKYGSHLYIFNGIASDIIERLIKENKVQAVFLNRDYTPFSRIRDKEIESVCTKNNVRLIPCTDTLLCEPELLLKADGKPYSLFTPFFRKAVLISVPEPLKNELSNYYSEGINFHPKSDILSQYKSEISNERFLIGGRSEGIKLLNEIHNLEDYNKQRDIPSVKGTSHLSPHHKFGTISIRESYHTIVRFFDEEHPLIRALFWRDFFTHIAYHFPEIFGKPFQKKYENIEWDDDNALFEKWCSGKTGFPIVDAGMRELNNTGYMHNRVRMIVASFLVKDLHIDWRLGEKYFAQHLVDYDPSVNNGNWQWCASTGCDAQPYFRIFNPWTQQMKFDPQCNYIKKWIPELKDMSPKEIHNPKGISTLSSIYPKPVVDHKEETIISKSLYSNIR